MLALEIRERTRDGSKMVDYAENIWLNRAQDAECCPRLDDDGRPIPGGYDDAQRWAAFVWLAERGYGKPVTVIDVNAMVAQFGAAPAHDDALDVDALDDDDLDALEALALKRLGVGRAPRERVIEATAHEVAQGDAGEAVPEHVEPERTPPVRPVASTVPRVVTFRSSNVRGASHDAGAELLEVTFANGTRWRYRNVTAAMVDAWVAAPSAGAWFAREIKGRPDRYPGRPVLGEGDARPAAPAGHRGPGVL